MFRALTERFARQDVINNEVHAFIQQSLTHSHTDNDSATVTQPTTTAATTATTSVTDVDEVKEGLGDIESQRYKVRHSRPSVYLSNTNNNNVFSPLASPTVRPRTEAEIERRASHGMLFGSPAPASKVSTHTVAAPRAVHTGHAVDKTKHSAWSRAHDSVVKMPKFYGDRVNDKTIDVYTFVRGIDFELNSWLGDEPYGRLELVIKCTQGPAQMWLLNKRDDLLTLVARGEISAEMAEWDEIKVEFIERMGGGQTQRLYQQKMDELKMKKGTDAEEVTKFIASFRAYSLRAYPLEKFPDSEARSLMLGKAFKERVAASDFYVWSHAMRMMPPPETLEEWELALGAAWTTENALREQRKKFDESKNKGGGIRNGYNGGSSSSQSASLNHVRSGDETGDDRDEGEQDTGEGLNAVVTKKGGKGDGKKMFNKHINSDMARKLIQNGRCLHCYKGDHFARACTTPATRPPTDTELKVKAGQQ